jgi:Ni/Co efflux regulator RcnB
MPPEWKEIAMTRTIFAVAIASAAAAAVATPAVAQSLNRQQTSQEHRIRQGVRTGELTPQEARRLQFLETRLYRTEQRMRMRNGGRLSPAERARREAMARRDSAEIYRLKHNRRVG